MTMSQKPTSPIIISVVVPIFNEGTNIYFLVSRLTATLEALDTAYEIILVDDGSLDRSWEYICEILNFDKNVKGITLSRNFGHQHALLAGFIHAQGKAIVSMDADLQHPPELIPKLFDAWKAGYKVVLTQRQDSDDSNFFKRMSSEYFYKLFSIITGIPMFKGMSDFRLVDRIVLESLFKFRDVDLFLRGIVNWLGFPSTVIPFKASKRLQGKTKYSLIKMLKFASGAIVSFSTKPLIIGIWAGFLTSFLAFGEILYILIKYFQGVTVAGWASTTSIISFLFGILFVLLGVLGIYLARIHQALQSRPRFIIAETVNFEQLP